MTHHATSNMTERGFHMMSACQIRWGCPRSKRSARITKRYPRNAVSTVGRMMGVKRFRLNRYTTAVRVKPPAARPTPHSTSKPIHNPQGT